MTRIDEPFDWIATDEQRHRLLPPPVEIPERELLPAVKRYDGLRVNFLTRYSSLPLKSILFVGTGPGEGTSTTAAHFAASLARGDRRVLLIDANLRAPALHRMFEVGHSLGLSNLLTVGAARMVPVAIRDNLYVLPSGGQCGDPVEVFHSHAFMQFMRTARERFDYVLLDGPVVRDAPEINMLCAKADGILLVVESGRTRKRIAAWTKQQVEHAGGKLLGVVLNKRRHYIPNWLYERI